MKSKLINTFLHAAGLGAIAGMRSLSAPAIVSNVYSKHPSRFLKNTPFNRLQTTAASKILAVLAVGEFIGDKLPQAPNRTGAAGLTGRILSGALCGAFVYGANRKNMVTGALIGSTAALASSYGCFYLRKAIGEKTKIADPIIGAVEDAVVIAAGFSITKQM